MSSGLLMPFSLIGISLFESSIVPTITPLLAAYNSLTKFFGFMPDKEIFELFSSSSILVLMFEVSDFVRLISGASLIISSNFSPSCFRTNGSSPKIT